MKLERLQPFESLPYFTIQGFKQSLGSSRTVDQNARELLSRWRRSGRVIALKRGVYITREFYQRHRQDADFNPAISAILNPLSYLSLEYVLGQAGVLSEATYPITAVTVKNTRTIQNAIGTYVYRHIQRPLYTGFGQQTYHGVIFHRASPAKALFDLLYLHPLPRDLRRRDLELAEELRLNLDEFPTRSRAEFEAYVKRYPGGKMAYILENFQRTVWRP